MRIDVMRGKVRRVIFVYEKVSILESGSHYTAKLDEDIALTNMMCL
jgi:hypothetical protein